MPSYPSRCASSITFVQDQSGQDKVEKDSFIRSSFRAHRLPQCGAVSFMVN
jgi:hypothetical protein